VKPGRSVLVYDDAGDHAALQAAELIAATGARVEIVTPDRSFAPEVMVMNLVPDMRGLQHLDTTFTVTWRLVTVAHEGDALGATLGSDYGGVTGRGCSFRWLSIMAPGRWMRCIVRSSRNPRIWARSITVL
jgi:hypothetical protein